MEGAKIEALGNDAADKRAKAAVAEGEVRGDVQKKICDSNAWGYKVACELGRSLAAWPPTHVLFGELTKQPRGLRAKQDAQRRQHTFEYVDGQLRCILCNFLPRRKGATHRECVGFPKAIVDVIKDRNKLGHKLKAAGAEGRLCIVWCTRCGCHARTVPRGLANKCNGIATRAGARALHLARQGQDPLDRSGF